MTGIAGLCVVAHLVALAHLVAVQHERCAEHGELVHASGAASESTTESQRVIPADAALPAYPGQADSEHDHCLSATERRDRHQGRVDQATRVPLDGQHACPGVDMLIARAIYRSAPKTSPPHIA